MAISYRQAGAVVECPTCGEQTPVPLEDEFSLEAPPEGETLQESDPTESPLDPPEVPSQPRADGNAIDERR